MSGSQSRVLQPRPNHHGPAVHISARPALTTSAPEVATQADVRRLVLTHLTPALDPGVSLEQAAGLFDGPIDVATRDAVWEVGR